MPLPRKMVVVSGRPASASRNWKAVSVGGVAHGARQYHERSTTWRAAAFELVWLWRRVHEWRAHEHGTSTE